jgi:cytosine/adenosine deaminase-related metal-dependent hydrolase
MQMKTLIKNTTAYLGEDFRRVDNTDILIDGARIAGIRKNIRALGAKKIDGSDLFVTPGLVNAHFHPSQQLNRALGIGLCHDEQMDLLHATDRIKRDEDKYWMSCIAVLEGLFGGTTCFQSVGSEIETQIPVYKNLGVRGVCVMIPKDIEAVEKAKAVRARVWPTEQLLKTAEEVHK